MLHRLFSLCLVIALLPWGAYANTVVRPHSIAAVVFLTDDDSLQAACARGGTGDAVQGQRIKGDAVLLAPRQCKGPALPGTPCHPVLGLLPEATDIPTGLQNDPPRQIAVHTLTGRVPAPSVGPPRAC